MSSWPTSGGTWTGAPVAPRMRAATFRAPSSSISSSGCPVQAGHRRAATLSPIPRRSPGGWRGSGIGDDTIVVAYDDAGGVIAARLVWMLRATGHEAALLNGGVTAYGGPLEKGSGSADLPHAAFTARAWPPDRLADAADAADRGNIVIDARDRSRYRGEQDPIDPRPGHIPGASNVPCRENLAADGTFLAAGVLRRRFEEVGVREGSTVISYCGSGVTACHNLLALELAGFAPGRLYPGSWSQYSQMPDVDIATGSSPG